MLMLLRRAAEGPIDHGTGIDRVADAMRRIDADPDAVRDEIERRVATALEKLAIAGLLSCDARGLYRTTPQGRQVLTQHPTGVDESVLMQFRAFRDFIRDGASRPAGTEARRSPGDAGRDYDSGYAAYGAGQSLNANPHEDDTAAHLAWEEGWFEAFDEAMDHTPKGGAGAVR